MILSLSFSYGIRLSFEAPSSLTAHLSQATIAITSVPQLCQLLRDEVENCLLQRICDVGKSCSEGVGGTWFVDLNRCVGRWDGCVLCVSSIHFEPKTSSLDDRNFRILYGDDFAIDCVAFRLDDVTGRHGRTQSYSADNTHISLFEWIARITQSACERRL